MRIPKILTVIGSLFLAQASFAQYHILIYSLPVHVGQQPDPSVYGLDYIDGVSARETWQELEPQQNVYQWGFFDKVVNDATAAGKFVELRVLVEGSNAPDWATNPPTVNFQPDTGEGNPLWVYWDANAQPMLWSMYQQLGARYASYANVKIVAVACDTDTSGDWSIPHDVNDISNWAKVGYTTQKNINAGESNLLACATAFPNQVVYLAGGRNGNLDGIGNDNLVAETIANYGYSYYGSHFEAGKNQLNMTTPDPFGTNGESAIGTNWQYLWDLRGLGAEGAQESYPAYGDQSYQDNGGNPPIPGGTELQNWAEEFRTMVQIAHDWNLVTLEVYEPDVLNLGYILKNNN